MVPNAYVEKVFAEKWLPLMEPFLTDLVLNKVLLKIDFNKECELGNLITNLIYKKFPFVDFVVLDPGALRNEWVPGMIKEKDFISMFPLKESLKKFNISGAELLKTIKIAQ